jgi:two-component system sensor histidine kinase KdpD
VHEGGTAPAAPREADLDHALASARGALEFDAGTRSYAGHRTGRADDAAVAIVPVRLGAVPIGLLAVTDGVLDPGTIDAIAGIVAIAFERSQFMVERHAAAIAHERAELSSALLAAMGHDLRTPLTALRVAVENLTSGALAPEARAVQAQLAIRQAERLTRTFDEILDMARIESKAISVRREWCAITDIVEAAAASVPALDTRRLDVVADPREEALVDPHLTASALAHLLENAERYSPPETPITVRAWTESSGMRISVADSGPGIPVDELPELFSPLYRGAAGRAAGTGTGMGLAITRGLLAAQNGRVWAENQPGGGAVFSIAVPGQVRNVELEVATS